ncbi:MAG: 5-formyltetrahydrofolate cyclo-ligase [Alphaproteobacteria bacterium]|nr:5-formyltetrahydrofolate cyclo-ligase [Alphaproteobacteria bacterium]
MENNPVKDAEINAKKQESRCMMQAKLQTIDWTEVSIQVLKNLKGFLQGSFKQKKIAGYWPIANEIDVIPFLKEWCLENGSVCLPVVQEKNSHLRFYTWTPEMEMELGLYQIPVPKERTNLVVPDIILIPLTAFDKSGHRLGKGGGYYDRTLQELRSIKSIQTIGLGAEAQCLPFIPHSIHDQPLDGIVTEKRIIPYH